MKVLVAHFTAECNEHISHVVTLEDFHILYGKECIQQMHIKDIFDKNEIELIPSIYASMHPNGMIQRESFDFIADKLLKDIKKNLKEIDGLYLQFHGASGVLNLDEVSGEHYLLKKIREITGKHMPIAMVMDPHGNITNELCKNLNIVRCYRESPHSDAVETERIVAEKLINLLRNRREMHPIIFKLPIMVGGERSVSSKEPIYTINQMMNAAEENNQVFSISYHVGYIRHDDDKLGAAVVIIPNRIQDEEYCKGVGKKIAQFAWTHRHQFVFSGNYDEPYEAVKKAVNMNKKTTVITDSGDNCGAGGYGQNTILLKEILNQKVKKNVLIAGINDKHAHSILKKHKIGDTFSITLGIGEDINSSPIELHVKLTKIGQQKYGFANEIILGPSYLIRVENTNIDIIVMNHNIQYGTMEQFVAARVNFHDYDIVIVKMGYLDTYLIPETSYHIMALTDGPTIQKSERIPFKKIFRPMWPIDEFDEFMLINI